MSKSIIFISQPMKGKPKEEINEERLKYVTKYTTEKSVVLDSVLNPDTFNHYKNKELDMLSKSLFMLALCDKVVMLPGWEGARGCRFEHDIAEAYGRDIIYEV